MPNPFFPFRQSVGLRNRDEFAGATIVRWGRILAIVGMLAAGGHPARSADPVSALKAAAGIRDEPASGVHRDRLEYSKSDDDLLEQFKRSKVPMRFSSPPSWRGGEMCGLNCLYLLLKLTVTNVPSLSYDALYRSAGPVPSGGFNMAQLKQIARKWGAELSVIQGDPLRLAELPPPVIVHLGEPDRPGHFVCLVQNQGKVLLFADGTTGGQFTVGDEGTHTVAGLARQASGFMLVPALHQPPRGLSPRSRWIMRGVSCGMLAVALVFFALPHVRRRRLAPETTSGG